MNVNRSLFSRRRFCQSVTATAAAAMAGQHVLAQEPGDRPAPCREARVLNPRDRVPVGLIIDDSTCLVNLNKFAMPQFARAHGGQHRVYDRDWKSWPDEIPDAFVQKFGEWCAEQGVKGKYSIVPYPACVGRLDRQIPGWSQEELERSLELVRKVMMPHWDIHPEMVTHTRIIDLNTGHPYPEFTPKFMENWDWSTGRSVDEIAAYQAYALEILKNAGLPCEGITTPGGYGNRARPQLAQASFEAVRSVFKAEVPHYFRDLHDSGSESVAPVVQNVRDLKSDDPKCVVHTLGCTGDWTGGWDNTEPEGADRFITADLKSGRMVEVITRGEPAMMVCHWTGIWWNGEEKGFRVFQEVVRRLKTRFDNLVWMKLSELARYWAAKECTALTMAGGVLSFHAPWACPDFTVEMDRAVARGVSLNSRPLTEVDSPRKLLPGTWTRRGEKTVACFALPKGQGSLEIA